MGTRSGPRFPASLPFPVPEILEFIAFRDSGKFVQQFSRTFSRHRNRSDFCDLRLRCLSRTPEIARFPRQEKAMLHCDLRVRWKVASDLRFQAAISEPKNPSFCGISGDLAPSTRKSLAIAIVRFWCPKGPPQPVEHYTISASSLNRYRTPSAIGVRLGDPILPFLASTLR